MSRRGKLLLKPGEVFTNEEMDPGGILNCSQNTLVALMLLISTQLNTPYWFLLFTERQRHSHMIITAQ